MDERRNCLTCVILKTILPVLKWDLLRSSVTRIYFSLFSLKGKKVTHQSIKYLTFQNLMLQELNLGLCWSEEALCDFADGVLSWNWPNIDNLLETLQLYVCFQNGIFLAKRISCFSDFLFWPQVAFWDVTAYLGTRTSSSSLLQSCIK